MHDAASNRRRQLDVDITNATIESATATVKNNSAPFGIIVTPHNLGHPAHTIVIQNGVASIGAMHVGKHSEAEQNLQLNERVNDVAVYTGKRWTMDELMAYTKIEGAGTAAPVFHVYAASPVWSIVEKNLKNTPNLAKVIEEVKTEQAHPSKGMGHTHDDLSESLYRTYAQALVDQTSNAGAATTDLSNFGFTIRRADGKAFRDLPDEFKTMDASSPYYAEAVEHFNQPHMVECTFDISFKGPTTHVK